MADETKISCPKCKHKFVLTEALAGPLLEKAKLEAEDALADARRSAHEEGKRAAATKFAEDMASTTRAAADAKEALAAAEKRIFDQNVALTAARNEQAKALSMQRELQEEHSKMALTIETRINEALGTAKGQARRESDAENALKLAEKEKALQELRDQLAEAKRKADHTDNRIQGEVQELELEKRLRETFPRDNVEPVAKGVHGGDSLLRVLNSAGAVCGLILFESKDTQAFDAKWLAKLRADQRTAGADLAVIVTRTMPKGVELFEQVDGVWVSSLPACMALTAALRSALFATYSARKASEGQETKAELLYTYLTGGGYKHRLSAMVEAVDTLQTGLTKEKAAIERQWSLRSATHDKLVASVVGMHGDVAGIAGQSVQELEAASLKALEAAE
jgi:hypothetical protein